jgi:hypothetical protein
LCAVEAGFPVAAVTADDGFPVATTVFFAAACSVVLAETRAVFDVKVARLPERPVTLFAIIIRSPSRRVI